MSTFNLFDLYNILFLDIETVPVVPDYYELPDIMQELWAKKAQSVLRVWDRELEEEEIVAAFQDRAGIYAEFGRIVCISAGFLTQSPNDPRPILRLKSFANHSEKFLLEDFSILLNNYFKDSSRFAICGHNIREFDVPYICRRMLINQLPFPNIIDIAGKKPWETKHLLDTLEMWKFGDLKNYTSLALLTGLFGIPTPKDDMDGSDVAGVYWEEKDLDRIAVYCEKDVLATVQLFLKFKRMPLLESDQVVVVR